MKRTSRFTFFFTFIFIVGFFRSAALAHASTDLTFICHQHECRLDQPFKPMFQESNIQPGNRFSQKLILKNLGRESGNFYLRLTLAPTTKAGGLVKALIISITSANKLKSILPPTFLVNLIDSPVAVRLGPIAPHQTKTFMVNFQFNPQADNSFQAKLAQFDFHFSLNFLGEPSRKKVAVWGQVTPSVTLDKSTKTPVTVGPAQTTKQIGQVLGVSTTKPSQLYRLTQFKAKLIKQVWFRKLAPFVAAGSSMFTAALVLFFLY